MAALAEECMVGTASTSSQTAAKPKKRGNTGLVVFLLVVMFGAAALLLGGFVMPTRLGIAHEQLLGIIHGGVASSEEQTNVECLTQGAEGPQAVTRTTRTTTFRDGTSLVITFSTSPAPTNSLCGG
jgi:hypothetical protein